MLVVLLTAHDLGLNATTALHGLGVIEGLPVMSAELMRMLARRDGHDVDVTVERNDNDRPVAAVCRVHRREWAADDWREARFTLADAVDAGLCRVDPDGAVRARDRNNRPMPWERWTEDMLVARATSRALRRYCEDSLGGVSYTPDELEAEFDEVEVVGEVVEDPPVDDEVAATLRRRIASLTDDQRETVRDAWKRAGYGSISENPGRLRRLTTGELPGVLALLDAFATPATPSADVEVDDEIAGEVGADVVGADLADEVDAAEPAAGDGDVCDECGQRTDRHDDRCIYAPF